MPGPWGAVAAVVLSALAPGGDARADPPDLPALLDEARRVQEADVESWSRHRFRRRALREKRDAAGGVLETEDLVFVVSPAGDPLIFDERLIEVDGRAPTPAEVSRHRQEARFTKHYKAVREGKGKEEQGGYSLKDLLRMSAYRYAGRETIDGVACHRLDFGPREAGAPDGVAGRFAAAMEGSLWLTVDGLHLIGATARSIRPISVVFLLARVTGLRLSLRSVEAGGGHWLPGRLEVFTEASVLGFGIRRRNLYEYDRYEIAR